MRNPSPPPLNDAEKEALSGDKIGDTMFSQSWVLSVLMKLCKHDLTELYVLSKQQKEDKNLIQEETVLELDEIFEKDICDLWDMTANQDVSKYLHMKSSIDIFLNMIKITYSPRLMEILFGILGNMCCIEVIHKDLSDPNNIDVLYTYLNVTDAKSLEQLTRLIKICMCTENTDLLHNWSDLLEKYFPSLLFIVKNSLNRTLLENTLEIVDIYFYHESNIIESIVDEDFVNTLFEVYNSLDNLDSMKFWVQIIQSIVQEDKIKETLRNHNFTIQRICECMENINSQDSTNATVVSINASIIFILDILLDINSNNDDDTLWQNFCSSNILKLAVSSFNTLLNVDLLTSSKEEMYLETFLGFFQAILKRLDTQYNNDDLTNKPMITIIKEIELKQLEEIINEKRNCRDSVDFIELADSFCIQFKSISSIVVNEL